MNDATLAQGNGVLTLILQKRKSAEEMQELLESGLLAELLDAKELSRVDRDSFRKSLGLKPVILVHFDPDGTIGGRAGCSRAKLRDEHGFHDAGQTPEEAIEALLRTLKSFGRSDRADDYEIIRK